MQLSLIFYHSQMSHFHERFGLTLHDIGSQDGLDFLVMEYLDEETVAQRLEKGALLPWCTTPLRAESLP